MSKGQIDARIVPPAVKEASISASEAYVPQGTIPPQVNLGMNAPVAPNRAADTNFTANPGYVKQSRGYPVEPGQTWHHLTPAQRNEWFRAHETRWKGKFGIASGSYLPAETWSRG
jgi:hypothetical protein